jgi:hypothetical protein
MAHFRAAPSGQPPETKRVEDRVDAAIRAVEALTIEPLKSIEQLRQRLAELRRGQAVEILLCELGSHILRFGSAAFPNLGSRTLLAQHFVRERSGRGAHFDVYGELLDEEFPWVALFNISGDAYVSTFQLPEALTRRYFHEHPAPSDEAFDARRRIAAEALGDPAVKPDGGVLYRHAGLIIPQLRAGPHCAHDVVPLTPDNPGQFVKLLVAAPTSRAQKQLTDAGYGSLDAVVTAALDRRPSAFPSSPEGLPQRRRCNLD